MSELRAVIRVKTMAAAAAATADYPTAEQGDEMARAYERLRREASAINERAGWGSAETFDEALPPITSGALINANISYARVGENVASMIARGRNPAVEAVARGARARVLLGQLSAWAAGHQEAFEIEERLRAHAAAEIAARSGQTRPVGFAS